jgi:anti-sigma regulatory factor (Ser/Thr protein kinase)
LLRYRDLQTVPDRFPALLIRAFPVRGVCGSGCVAVPWRVLREVGASRVVHLPCAPASVALARQALSEELTAAGIFDTAVSAAALVVSELLSNAILHAYPLPGERLRVAWAVNGNSVEVAVSDGGSATMPHAGHPSPSSVSGRGLSIVENLSQNWGVRAEEVGLTVWAVLPAPRGDQHADDGSCDGSPGRAESADPDQSWQRAGAVAARRQA